MYGLRQDDDFLAKFHRKIHRNDEYFCLKNGRKIGRKIEKKMKKNRGKKKADLSLEGWPESEELLSLKVLSC